MTEPLVLVRATLDDWKIVSQIEKSAVGRLYSSGVKDEQVLKYLKSESILLGYVNKKLVGKISYKKLVNSVHISGLVVLPSWRNKGFGTLLARYVVDIFPLINRFELFVHPDNKPAISIYNKLGFMTTQTLENPFGDGERRLKMQFIRVKS